MSRCWWDMDVMHWVREEEMEQKSRKGYWSWDSRVECLLMGMVRRRTKRIDLRSLGIFSLFSVSLLSPPPPPPSLFLLLSLALLLSHKKVVRHPGLVSPKSTKSLLFVPCGKWLWRQACFQSIGSQSTVL